MLYLLVTCSCAYCGVLADWPVTDDMLCKSFTLSSSFTQAVRDCAKLRTKKAKITCTRITVSGQASRPYHNSENSQYVLLINFNVPHSVQ